MSRIRGRDTKPEVRVRSALHRAGFRFRLCPSGLPGRPDIVLRRDRIALFVHGCFWHRHQGCSQAYHPKSNVQFWARKFRANQVRDRKVGRQLRALGWNVVVIWECGTKNESSLHALAKRLRREAVRSRG